MAELSDEELSGLTVEFMERVKQGESLEHILPEAFAAMVEADDRVLGLRPYDVQIMAGIALHYGYLAEMNTGEGKTLSATMPLYLNALTGRSCMLVTTNEYLAVRDANEMGPVYEFMGLTCSRPKTDADGDVDDKEYRMKMYSANIVYLTNAGLGFDYLFNNLIKRVEDRFIKDMYYAIIDEADAVLLDAAIMPLVVSGAPRVQSNLYAVSDFFVTTLEENQEYIEEKKAVWLSPEGVKYAEDFFGIENYYGKSNFEINRHVTLALRAHKLLKKQRDYLVTDEGEVGLFDGATGRIMKGVKLTGGQHQAIEAKEGVEITQEYRTLASITFRNLFMMFDKYAGMSGTLTDDKDELFDTYNKRVVRIPTNRPIIREDRKDHFYPNAEKQFAAAARRVVDIHRTGQPVLVVLNSVVDTDLFSQLMFQENIPHNVLNASNAFWEADIIKYAGQKDAVTVATPMAGRGTDIKLGKGVRELGGLAVIGVGRMSNNRSERQARGRAGRQGDPGFSEFYISLDDDVVGAEEDDERMQRFINEKRRISKRKIRKIVNSSQKYGNESAKVSRKETVQYDSILHRQRTFIYETRNNLLDGENVPEETLIRVAAENIQDYLESQKTLNINELNRYILDNISYTLDSGTRNLDLKDKDAIAEYLIRRVRYGMELKKHILADTEKYDQFVREATLSAVDNGWIDLIDYLQQLQSAVSGRSFAQRNVTFEYNNEAYRAYKETEKRVKNNIMRYILLCEVTINPKNDKVMVIYPD